MRYIMSSFFRNIANNEDISIQLIAKKWIQGYDYYIYILAEEKGCEIDEITEQDCIEYLKSQPKVYDSLKKKFWKNCRCYIEKIEDLEEMQKSGILDKLPPEVEYEYGNFTGNITQVQLEQFSGRNIIFKYGMLSSDFFNMICTNGFSFEPSEGSENIQLENINVGNIDETIRNIIKYNLIKFNLHININNAQDLETIINRTSAVENVSLRLNIHATDMELTNILHTLKNGKNIEDIKFNFTNEGINSIEQLFQNIDLFETFNVSRMSLHINLDEEYIKSLNEEDIKKVDSYIEGLENRKIFVGIDSTDPHLEWGTAINTKRYKRIGEYFMHYNKIQDVIGNIPSEAGDIDKITYISNWIMQNFSYDYVSYERYQQWIRNGGKLGDEEERNAALPLKTILDFLEDRIGVCEDIAKITEYIARKVGLECKHISSNHHSFNIVYIEGVPYWLDNTWDINLHDQNGAHELSNSPYFLTSTKDFLKTHSKYDAVHRFECPETIDREKIRESLEKTANWKHIIAQSIQGDELYSKTRIGLLTRIGKIFKRFTNKGKYEKEEKING